MLAKETLINDASIVRLVGALLLEQQEEWQLDGQAGRHLRSISSKINQQLHLLQLPDHHAAVRSQASGLTPLGGTPPLVAN